MISTDRSYRYRNKGYRGFDPRLEVMDASWFVGAKCLDVGCNAGIFTLDLAVLFDIGSILGVDIDQKLITKAKGNLVKYVGFSVRVSFTLNRELTSCRYQKLADNSRIMPDSAIQPQHQAQTETEQTGSQNTDSNVSSQTTTNIQQEVNAKKRLLTDYVSFRHEDYTKAPTTPDSYNIITCMSVLKWIHINTGDDGIRAVFKKFCAEIKEGGYLIIEPQPWSSYKPKKLTTEGKAAYKALKLRPDDFDGLLKTEGFSFVFSGKPETSIGGFSCREIRVYQKKTPSILTS